MAWGPSRSSLSARRPFQSPLLARRPCRRRPSTSPCRRRPGFLSCRGHTGFRPSNWLRSGIPGCLFLEALFHYICLPRLHLPALTCECLYFIVFIIWPITFGFVHSGHQHYVAVWGVPFLIIVLFLPVGFWFNKVKKLICIWTQISIFPRASTLRRDTEWRHSSPTLFEPESDDETLKWLIDKRLIRKHDVFLSGKCQVLTSLW